MIYGERHWSEDAVVWGTTLCETRCGHPADGLLDGVPTCVLCAGVVVERWAVATTAPRHVLEHLPPIFGRDEERRRR